MKERGVNIRVTNNSTAAAMSRGYDQATRMLSMPRERRNPAGFCGGQQRPQHDKNRSIRQAIQALDPYGGNSDSSLRKTLIEFGVAGVDVAAPGRRYLVQL